jgi:hypothetical protein
MGRHSAADDAGGGSPGPAVEAPKPRRESAIRADLRLLRTDRWLRIRCSVALIVPFVALFGVLVLLGRAGSFFIWFWIPAILAGVAAGHLLDRAHRKAAARATRR